MPRFSIEELKTMAASQNVAEFLEEEELGQIGKDVVNDYDDDEGDLGDKIAQWDEILGLAMQVRKEKNFPWPKASNVKYPIIAQASISFAARVYPEIVQSGRVARVKVQGADPEGEKQDRAIRVEDHLNYQITEDIKNWEPDTDVLLALLPIYGCYYKKVYFSQIENKPVVEIYNPKEVVTSNKSSALDEEDRISTVVRLNSNAIIERIRAGLFLNVEIPPPADDSKKDKEEGDEQDFIEQHCFLDLDEDGYKEPYIVTVHKESNTLFRIVARFTEDDIKTTEIDGREVISKIFGFTHWIRYLFAPAFDGSQTGLGFGELLVPLNEAINTHINQLTDAGTLANHAANSGFVGRGIRTDSGPFRLTFGEWLPVETRGASLKDNIFPLPAVEPSQTIFALLGLLIDTAKSLASASEVAPGEIPANTPATTILAIIEEGMKVYSSIYKRIFNSIKEELRKIYYLNKLYGDPEEYEDFQDIEGVSMSEDYEFRDKDVAPVASPEVSSDMMRITQAQGLVSLLDSQVVVTAGGLDPRAVVRNYLTATRQPNVEQLQPPPPPPPEPGSSLEEQMIAINADLEAARIENDERETQIKAVSEFVKSMKALAEAEAAEEGSQLQMYRDYVNSIAEELAIYERASKLEQEQAAQLPEQPQTPVPTGPIAQ